MRSMVFAPMFASLSLLSGTAHAQALLVAGQVQANVLRAGTEVPMKTRVALTTKGKALRVGDRIELEVAENVTLNSQTVIPAGTPAMGEITSIRNKGMWGKSGSIEARVLYLRVGDRQIRCSGVFNDKGSTGTAGVVGAAVLVPVAGFFMTGTSADIPLGAVVKAFLDEDVPVQFAVAPAQPAPLTVAVVQTAVAAAASAVTPIATDAQPSTAPASMPIAATPPASPAISPAAQSPAVFDAKIVTAAGTTGGATLTPAVITKN